MAKRPADALDGGVLKRVKPQLGPEHPEGSWACGSCGNVNWPKRTQCNKAGCNMRKDAGDEHPEGSWACLMCNNVNWPKRTHCHKASCGAPRSGTPTTGSTGTGGMGISNILGSLQPALSQHPDGSWVCLHCNNVNWPMRTTCNKQGCGEPKGASPPPSAPISVDPLLAYYQAQAAQAGMGAMGASLGGAGGPYGGTPYTGYHAYNAMTALMAGASGGANPPGSWPCSQCGNINWPKRTTCNKAGCGAARVTEASNGGGASAHPTAHPEGSWPCPSCGNVNWPRRTVCNKPGCDTPRP